MRTIRIGFSSPKKFKIGAELIKLWAGKSYSHTYINWVDDQGRDIIFQSAHGTVHTLLKDNFELENIIHKEIFLEITEEQYQALRDFCYYYCGQVYATSDLVIIVLYDIAIRLGGKPIFEDVEGFICSEILSLALTNILDIELPKPTYLMRPDDVEALLETVIWKA
jgi:hypothetical protein